MVYCDACLRLLVIMHVLRSMMFHTYKKKSCGKTIHVRWLTIISMYHDLWRYMLTYGDVRDDDACTVINNDKHASRSTMVHAYIWRVLGIAMQAQWLTIISMYRDPPSIFKHVPLNAVMHAWSLCMHCGLWQSMLTKGGCEEWQYSHGDRQW